jgi:hypothetical protein
MSKQQVRAQYTQEFKLEAVPSGRFDISQRQGQPILQRGAPGGFERLGHALIHEQKGQLLG